MPHSHNIKVDTVEDNLLTTNQFTSDNVCVCVCACVCVGLPVFQRTWSLTNQGTSCWRLWTAAVAWKSSSKDTMTFLPCVALSCQDYFGKFHLKFSLVSITKDAVLYPRKEMKECSSLVNLQSLAQHMHIFGHKDVFIRVHSHEVNPCIVNPEQVYSCRWISGQREFQVIHISKFERAPSRFATACHHLFIFWHTSATIAAWKEHLTLWKTLLILDTICLGHCLLGGTTGRWNPQHNQTKEYFSSLCCCPKQINHYTIMCDWFWAASLPHCPL